VRQNSIQEERLPAAAKYRKLCERLRELEDLLVQSIHRDVPNQDSLGQILSLKACQGKLALLRDEIFPYIRALDKGKQELMDTRKVNRLLSDPGE